MWEFSISVASCEKEIAKYSGLRSLNKGLNNEINNVYKITDIKLNKTFSELKSSSLLIKIFL